MFILLLLLLLVGAQCPERAGGRDPECRVRCLFLCPQLVPGAPSPSSPPPPLPSPALPLVPGSLRRTHHDGRRRAAPDSVSTRDGGARRREARAPRDAVGGSRRAGPKPGLSAAPWPRWRGRLVLSSSVPFSLERKPSLLPQSLPGAWVLCRPFPLAPFFAHLS